MLTQIQKAMQLIEDGDKAAAAEIFEKVKVLLVDDLEVLVERGRLAYLLDENVFAANTFSKLVEIQPDNSFYLYLLAITHKKLGNLKYAANVCREIIKFDTEHYEPYYIIGKEAAEVVDFPEAVHFFEKAVQINPDGTDIYHDLIPALSKVGRQEDALKYAEKLLSIDTSPHSHLPISRILIELGRADEAVVYLNKALEIDDTYGFAYSAMASAKKFSSDDREFIEKAENVLKKSIPAYERSRILFSLGKMHNDCKEWDKAFEYFKQANVLDKESVEPTWSQSYFERVRKVFDQNYLRNPDGFSNHSKKPVFIFGMPRSGTTLLEQIIASHSEADGAGELIGITEIFYKADLMKKDVDVDTALSKEKIIDYTDIYLNVLSKSREDAIRIVDKQPGNFVYLGLMYKLFPDAYFIHSVRHPLDTCLSCYFQSFTHIKFATDIVWLGRYYCHYREAITHWKTVLPEGKILDVRYEDVVQDIEKQSRRVIDFCELPWDERCLEFYKSSRAVLTASLWQVRQPVYSSSKKRWINYAKHLGPLANEISEYLSDEDIDELGRYGVKVKKKWGLKLFKR